MNAPGLIVILTIVALIVGGSFVVGAPVFAVPILLLLGGAAFALLSARKARGQRDVREFRAQAESGTEFSGRDRETQTRA